MGQLVPGLAVCHRGFAPWPMGVGMIPRGAVALMFAGIGLMTRVIDQMLYTPLLTVVLLRPLVVPPWLGMVFQRPRNRAGS